MLMRKKMTLFYLYLLSLWFCLLLFLERYFKYPIFIS